MPQPKHLHIDAQRNVDSRPGFAWLSAPGSAALSLLQLHVDASIQVFGGILSEITDIPQRVWLKNTAGEVIDEAMCCMHDSTFLITCHGGPGVRRAIEGELTQAGLQQVVATVYQTCAFTRRTLGLLQHAYGASATAMVLEAARETGSLRNLLAAPDQIRALLAETTSCRYLFSPPRVQLWGPVNAGKSSLLNKLCGQSLAAVGDEPGLTRDVIEGKLEHEGFEIRVFDAPGFWSGGTALDADAQQLSKTWRDQADLVLELVPPGAEPQLANAMVVFSQADEPGSEGVSVKRAETIEALKSRLVQRFFGTLRALPASGRFTLHADLREDLQRLCDERMNADELRLRWLD